MSGEGLSPEAAKRLAEKKKKINALLGSYKRKQDNEKVVLGWGKDLSVGVKRWVKFDIPLLDELCGGVPCGQFTVVAGPEGAGKSTLATRLAANVQKRGGVVAWADIENQLDPGWLAINGVDPDELLVIKDTILEHTLDKVRELLETGAVNLLIVDSVTALASLQELEDKKGTRSLEDNTVAVQARKLSQFFRITTGLVGKSECAVVLIGQIRSAIGSYGNFEMIPGGNALKHYARLRLRVRRGRKADAPKEGKGKDAELKGFNCVIKIDKVCNASVRSEGQEVAVPFLFESGFAIEQMRKFTEEDAAAETAADEKLDGAW